MLKTFTGTTISYGPLLPAGVQLADGSLFFKTAYDADGITNPPGLYLYSFQQDTSTGTLGDQVGRGWKIASDLTNYVLKAGDAMTGALEVPGYLRLTQASGAQRILIGNQDSGGVSRPSIIEAANGTLRFSAGSTWVNNGGTLTSQGLYVDPGDTAGGLKWQGGQVWHAANDGAGSGLDADTIDGYQATDLLNPSTPGAGAVTLGPAVFPAGGGTQGTLPITQGGTGTSTPPTLGAVIYAASTSALSSTLGTIGQLLQANPGSAPTWISPSLLSVASATTASQLSTSRSFTLTGDASGTANFNGTANVSITTTVSHASAADSATLATKASTLAQGGGNGAAMTFNWSGQAGTPTWVWGGTDGVNHYVYNPANFHVSLADTATSANSVAWTNVSGRPTVVSAFTNDAGYLTSAGLSNYLDRTTGGTVSGNITMSSGAKVTGLPTPTVASDAVPLTYLQTQLAGYATTGSLSGYVPLTGTTTAISGLLKTTAGEALRLSSNNGQITGWNTSESSQTGYIQFNQGSSVLIAAGAGVSTVLQTAGGSLTLSAAGAVLTTGQIGTPGSVRAGNGTGGVQLDAGDGTHTGTIGFYASNNVRQGYIGNAVTGSADAGTLNYQAGAHSFAGSITATGNITAYLASDERLKTEIVEIPNALDKVHTLRGVTYTKISSGARETGLIAQDLQKVLPEVVRTAEGGEDAGYLAVNYAQTVGLLVEAIKELSFTHAAQIAELRAEIDALKKA